VLDQKKVVPDHKKPPKRGVWVPDQKNQLILQVLLAINTEFRIMDTSKQETAKEQKMFEAGKTYSVRSACDYDSVFTIKVLSRTPKTIRAKVRNEEKTLRIGTREGREFVKPFGSYSMAPTIFA